MSLQTVYLPHLDASVVENLKREFRERNLTPVLAWGHRSGLEAGRNPSKLLDLMQTMKVARELGCRLVRIVTGDQTHWPIAADKRIAALRPLLSEVGAAAKDLRLTVAIENHADFAMADLVRLVEAVAARHVGICFDSGNAVRVGDDLHASAVLAGPHIRMVHLKDMVVQEASRGNPDAWWPAAPLGRGHFDLPRLIGHLQDAGYDGALFIEMANMFTEWPDEDAAVAASVEYLRTLSIGIN